MIDSLPNRDGKGFDRVRLFALTLPLQLNPRIRPFSLELVENCLIYLVNQLFRQIQYNFPRTAVATPRDDPATQQTVEIQLRDQVSKYAGLKKLLQFLTMPRDKKVDVEADEYNLNQRN